MINQSGSNNTPLNTGISRLRASKISAEAKHFAEDIYLSAVVRDGTLPPYEIFYITGLDGRQDQIMFLACLEKAYDEIEERVCRQTRERRNAFGGLEILEGLKDAEVRFDEPMTNQESNRSYRYQVRA